ncbi:MAG: lytic transglycosylase domain-containing protein [Desulfobacteraceae bacterium]|nr:lytic transglycosylase domain-containing protein [Desulfobacteraceae bacterium]
MRIQTGQADGGQNRPHGSAFARELEAGMAEINKSGNSGEKDRIRLGTISDHNPTVSHLLMQRPDYAQECWDIVHSHENRGKPYTRMPAGTEVYMDAETREILWTGGTRDVSSHPVPARASGDYEMQEIEETIHQAATKHNLSRRLIAGVIRAESGFNTAAVSDAGAQGLMQLMPDTARELGVENPFDIRENIDAGVRYLKQMLHRFGGSLEKALAAYNAGPGAVERFGGEVPYKETRQYVARVLSFLE